MKAIPMVKPSKQYQKAVNCEIKRRMLNMADLTGAHFDSLVLYTLAKNGWGKYRLRKFYEDFDKAMRGLCEYYDGNMLNNQGIFDVEFCALAELKQIGVDVEHWRKSKGNWEPEKDECWMAYNHGRKPKKI